MLPDDWEEIDIETMPLPESKPEPEPPEPEPSKPELPEPPEPPAQRRKQRRPPEPAAQRRKQRRPKKPPSKRAQRAKKKRKRKRQSCLSKFLQQDNTTVERKPIYTQHALERLQQGRSGEFVTRKKGNAVVVVTILPSNGYARREIETIRVNRKQGSQKYKLR